MAHLTFVCAHQTHLWLLLLIFKLHSILDEAPDRLTFGAVSNLSAGGVAVEQINRILVAACCQVNSGVLKRNGHRLIKAFAIRKRPQDMAAIIGLAEAGQLCDRVRSDGLEKLFAAKDHSTATVAHDST